MSNRNRVHALVKTLAERIGTGVYPVNSKLPSCRQIGKEFGVSAATANLAYSELERAGLVENVPRVGTFVRRQSPLNTSPTVDQLQEALRQWLSDARRSGLDREAVEAMFADELAEAYSSPLVHLIFVECNKSDAHHLARHASEALGVDVVPVLVDQLGEWCRRQKRTGHHVLAMTTYYHLSEVRDIVSPYGYTWVALHHVPTEETAARIAGLPSGIHLGAVATNARTLERLVALATMYHGSPQSVALVNDPEAVAEVRRRADFIVTTHSCREAVLSGWDHPERLIMVEFQISDSSLQEVRSKLLPQLLGGGWRAQHVRPTSRVMGEIAVMPTRQEAGGESSCAAGFGYLSSC